VPRRTLESLTWDECVALLGQASVGRLVYEDDLGPAAVPVIYGIAGQDIVFRSEGGSKIEALHDRTVGFEVDSIDEDTHTGWSVLARGTSREVEFEQLPELVRQLDGDVPIPWKKGIHLIWVTISPTSLTGRRLADFAFEGLL